MSGTIDVEELFEYLTEKRSPLTDALFAMMGECKDSAWWRQEKVLKEGGSSMYQPDVGPVRVWCFCLPRCGRERVHGL